MTDSLEIMLLSPGMPHHGGTLAERSLGGSETAAIMVSRALAARGHKVTVLSPGHQGGVWDGVEYQPIEHAAALLASTPHDVTVVSRAPEAFAGYCASAVRILWLHDLAIKRQRNTMAGIAWQLDAVYTPSAFHAAQVRTIHPLLGHVPTTVIETRNGIDADTFARLRAENPPRDPWKLVYGSRPERGLEQALAIMARCARRGLNYRLVVSHYDNTVPEMAPHYERWWAQARGMPNVELRGALKQAEWHREIVTARAVLYPHTPGPFREISCLVAMEAQAAGTPVVYARKGALPETVSTDAGIGIGDENTDPNAADYQEAFVDALARLADDTVWEPLHAGAIARGSTLGWDGVAAQWEADWQTRLAVGRDDAWRMARHWERIGERDAAASPSA